jgi:hypothetical protein
MSKPGMKKSIIKGLKTPVKKCSKKLSNGNEHLHPEYKFDYSKARPNRFARRGVKTPLIVALDPDVARVFATAESVNHALRAIMTALPK